MIRLDSPPLQKTLTLLGPVLVGLVFTLGGNLRAAEPTIVVTSPDEKLDPERTFAHANSLFEKAKSDEDLQGAANDYRRLLAGGVRNAHVLYNLGNTHLRLREHGLAILYFRQALRFDPNHPWAGSMLEYSRRQVIDRFQASEDDGLLDTLFFWHSRYDFRSRLWTLIVALLTFWVLLTLRLYTRIPFHRFSLTVTLLVSIAMGGSVISETMLASGEAAVLVADKTEVRSGNAKDYDLVFEQPIHSGVEVTILDTRGLWHQLQFPGGDIGWVPTSAARLIDEFD